MGNNSQKIKVECGKFKYECEGSPEKIIDAAIQALQQLKKVIDIGY